MQKELLGIKNKNGFFLTEAIISAGIFMIIVAAVSASYFAVSRYVLSAGAETQALSFAQEGLEAVRNIRDNNFASLAAGGPYGLSSVGNAWSFSGTQDVNDIYTRKISITAPSADTRQVTAQISWTYKGENKSLTQQREFTSWRSAKIKLRGGVLVYADGGTSADAIKYRVMDNNAFTWNTASSVADIDSSTTNKVPYELKLYASKTRNEKVLISRHYNGTAQSIYAQVYNGTSWGNVQLLATWNAATFLDVQNFDGTYLNNGDFMTVFSDNSVTPKTRTWNGSAWGSQSSLTTLGSSQTPNYIVTRTRPGTNEVMAAFFTQGSDTITQYYSGSTWSAITTHSTSAPLNTKQLVDFVWSPNTTTKGAMVFSNGNVRYMSIRIWTANGSGSGSWSAVANTSNFAAATTRVGSVSVSGRKGADAFLACVKDSIPSISCYESNMTPVFINPSNQTMTASSDTGIEKSQDIAYEATSGTEAIAVYSDNTSTPKLKKYNPIANSFDAAAASAGTLSATLRGVSLVSLEDGDDIMAVLMNGTRVYTEDWDGANNAIYSAPAGKAFSTHGTNGPSATSFWADFAWDAN